MSVRKAIIMSAAGAVALTATAAMAGGPDLVAMPVKPAFEPYVYIEANVGYAQSDWKGMPFFPPFAFPIFRPGFGISNGRGGFTVGGDLGYMFTRHLGLEIGAYYLPRVRGRGSFALFPPLLPPTLTVNSWLAYIAAKMMVPMFWDNFDIFGKIGAAYRQLRWSGVGAAGIGNNQYWRPMFAIGFQYVLDNAWIFDIQYIRVPGYQRATPVTRRAPAANLWTFSLGYMFAV